MARHNRAEPDAGRRLLSWAHAAGLRDTVTTTTAWCFATPAERAWWGSSWAGRATGSAFATQAVAYGLATPAELARVLAPVVEDKAAVSLELADIAAAWLRWADADDGWLALLHGELLIRVPGTAS